MNIRLGLGIGSGGAGLLLGYPETSIALPMLMKIGIGGWMSASDSIQLAPTDSIIGEFTAYFAMNALNAGTTSTWGYHLRSGSTGVGKVHCRYSYPTNVLQISAGISSNTTQVSILNSLTDGAGNLGETYVAVAMRTTGITVRSNKAALNGTAGMSGGTLSSTNTVGGSTAGVVGKLPAMLIYSGAHSNAVMDAIVNGGYLPGSSIYPFIPATQGTYGTDKIKVPNGDATLSDASPTTYWTIAG